MTYVPIERELQDVAGRFQRRALWRNLTIVWLVALAAIWLLPRGVWITAVSLAAAVAVLAALVRRVEMRWVAGRIEETFPELQTKLLAAYEQELRAPVGRRGFLEEEVIREARIHALTHGRWRDTVPTRGLRGWSIAQGTALGLLVAAFLFTSTPASSSHGESSESAATSKSADDKFVVAVEPGDVELERGTDLLVLARFADDRHLPRDVVLTADDASGERRLPLQQSLSDPIFAVRLPEVRSDLTYRLSYAAETTQTFRVTVFDYPELDRADAELTYPKYADMPVRRVEDVRHISLLEGTELRLLCRLNKPVQTARLVPREGEPIALTATADDPTSYVWQSVPQESVRLRLELLDDKGRANRNEVEFVVDVVPNRPPEVKLVFPKKDLKVSPLQEVPLEAEVLDDFGVVRWGLTYELPGKKSATFTLGEKLPGKEKAVGKHLVALEALAAAPDELLAYHAWAEDVGPDGLPRRTTSDIYFAEVSPFDEIFREATSDGGMPGGGKPQAADESLNLQKEIIAATWNLKRRETSAEPSAAYAADAQVIAESQQKAIDALAEAKEKLQSPEAKTIVVEIERDMQAALAALSTAAKENRLPPLDEALRHEQAAYQGLLKLRARETQIMRSKGSPAGGGGGQQSAAGQNLDELDLNDEEQRYETQNRAADPQQTAADREKEEFLKRLRELARRQEDMNDKIKELQAALEAAKDEAARRELERQLKRLRDEQREMLRDVDELKNGLDRPQHNAPQAEASKQLEATRENVRKASDALDKGEVPQALTAGTRAESELDKLREDFRKRTANHLNDEVRDLVEKARDLDKRQQQIGNQLAGREPSETPAEDNAAKEPAEAPRPPTRRGLRSEATPDRLVDDLAKQQQEFNEVLEAARDLTQRAEGDQPLLSKQLYDVIRETHQQQTEKALDVMRKLVDNGLPTEAARVEPQAQQGVRQLREGIEKAAEGVLGDDVETLRRAKRDVDRLAMALENELQREGAAPQSAKRGNDSADRDDAESGTPSPSGSQLGAKSESKESDAPTKEGKASTGKEPGERTPSESKPSDGQPSEGKPGEGKQPGEGEKPSQESQPGEQSGQGQGEKGQGQGEQAKGQQGDGQGQGEGEGKGDQPGEGQTSGQGQTPGQGQGGASGKGTSSGESPSQRGPGLRGGGNPPSQSAQPPQPGSQAQPNAQSQPGEQAASATGGNVSGPHGVLNGPDWREWSDALRNVEEFVPGTKLRGDAARVREQAQALRAEAKRHSKPPNWDLVRETVYEPLLELQQQLDEELLRKESPDAAVPLDRDPVPDRFGEAVRKYYEQLGSGK